MCPDVLPVGAAAGLKLKTRVFAVIVILSNALGNFSLTWGMRHLPAPLTLSPIDYIRAIFTPWVMLGILLLILWLMSRMALLSWADLSYVLPVTSIGYVLVALAGKLLLNEQITGKRWAGILLIVAGVALVSGGSAPRTDSPRGASTPLRLL